MLRLRQDYNMFTIYFIYMQTRLALQQKNHIASTIPIRAKT